MGLLFRLLPRFGWHSGYFAPLAQKLAAAGYLVAAFDLQAGAPFPSLPWKVEQLPRERKGGGSGLPGDRLRHAGGGGISLVKKKVKRASEKDGIISRLL